MAFTVFIWCSVFCTGSAIHSTGVTKQDALSLLRDMKAKYKMAHKKTMEQAAIMESDRNSNQNWTETIQMLWLILKMFGCWWDSEVEVRESCTLIDLSKPTGDCLYIYIKKTWSHCTPTIAFPDIKALQTMMRVQIWRKSTVSQSIEQRTICCSASAKPRSRLLFSGRRRPSGTTPSTSVEQFYIPGNRRHRGPVMAIAHHHPGYKWKLKKRWRRRTKGCFLKKLKKDTFQSQIHVSFYRGTIKSISDRKITNWHGSRMAHGQERLCSVWLILPGTSLAPVDRPSAIRMKWNVCTERRRQRPSRLQCSHHGAVALQPWRCQMSLKCNWEHFEYMLLF